MQEFAAGKFHGALPLQTWAGGICLSRFMEFRRAGGWAYSTLMFAPWITLAHFSVSSAMNLPKSADEPGSTVPPRSTSRCLIFGSARPALISLFSLSRIFAGVFFGAAMPYHEIASYPGTK